MQNDTSIRLRMMKLRPLLAAENFHNKLRILLEAVIGYQTSSATRRSHNYLQYECRAYHRIAAFNGIIEPQQDGCLHWRIMLYSSVLTLELLQIAAVAPVNVQTQIGQMLDSITCTTLPPKVHQCYNDTIASVAQGIKQPRAVEMEVPDASIDYVSFIFIGMKNH